MSVTPQDFADYANSGVVEAGMTEDLATAQAAVEEYVRANVPAGVEVPAPVLDQAVTEATANLWDRRQAPGGQANEIFGDGQVAAPIRISRDPLAPVRPLLAPWVTPLGFA